MANFGLFKQPSRISFILYGIVLLLGIVNHVSSAENNDSTSRRNADPAAHCVWYGECNVMTNGLKQNCPYNGPAKPLTNSSALETLNKWCPHLFPDGVKEINTCCDVSQIYTFEKGVQLAATFLKRCPSCMANFARHLCGFTCGTDQSNFIEIVNLKNNSQGIEYIDEMDLYITNDYIEGAFSSCKQVSVPSGGQLALDFMCGTWGASRCTASRWFTHMGTADNMFVPFQINYKNVSGPVDKFYPLKPTVTPCNQSVDSTSAPCSCVDCEQSCPVPPPPPSLPQPFTIAGLDGYAVMMTIVFIVGSSMFLLVVLVCPSRAEIGVTLSTSSRVRRIDLDLMEDHQGNKQVTKDPICNVSQLLLWRSNNLQDLQGNVIVIDRNYGWL